MPEATEALFRGLPPGVRVVEACDLSLLGAPVDIQGIPGTIHEKREALERMTSKLEVLNPHQAFVLLNNAFAIPKLQYVLRASPAYLCGEELSVFDRALFDSLGRVANVSLEGDVCKQAGLPVSFGGLGCRRAGDIALPSFIASMNSVGELVETILSRINIARINKYSAGCSPRHSAMNDVIKRALQKAGLPSVLEPPGLDRGDGSHPDGITVFPFSGGSSLIWDCTCVDNFSGVHLNRSAMEAGTAANNAEERKRRKYAALAEAHQFEPIAVETMGVYGESTVVILRAIGRRLVEATGEPREVNWFRQNLAIAIQRGNAFSILSAGRERF